MQVGESGSYSSAWIFFAPSLPLVATSQAKPAASRISATVSAWSRSSSMTRTRSWSSATSVELRWDFITRFRNPRAAKWPQRLGILPGRVQLDTRLARPDVAAAAKSCLFGTTIKYGRFGLRWEEWANAVTPGANIVTDTRVLLNRIAEFRQRLEAIPRLVPTTDHESEIPLATDQDAATDVSEPASRTQAILEYSVRQIGSTADIPSPALTNEARRLMAIAHGLVTRLKAMADDPLLAGPPNHRRMWPIHCGSFPRNGGDDRRGRYADVSASAKEQERLCEAWQADRRGPLSLRHPAGAVEQRRAAEQDRPAGSVPVVHHSRRRPLDPAPILTWPKCFSVKRAVPCGSSRHTPG